MVSRFEAAPGARAIPATAHPSGGAAPALPLRHKPFVAVPESTWRLREFGRLVVGARVALPMLVAVATGLRLWHFADIPRYADEIQEIMPAFDIARGESFPLTSGPKHIGAGFDYLLAGLFLVFGRSPDLPRLVLVVSGVLTVLLVYGYARSLRGHGAGLMAAGLLAVSAPHVLLSSRVAWSVSLTPLLITGAAWALDQALTRRRPRWLLAAGLLTGLALQAHPSVLTMVPGLGLFAVLRGVRLLRRPEPYLALALCLLGSANVLVYNWASGVGGLRSVTQQYPGEAVGLAGYLGNAAEPWVGFVLALASAVDPRQAPSVFHPFVLLVAAVAAIGLVYTARRVSMLPLLTVLGSLLLLPLVHDDFLPLLKSRYLMPLLPLTFVTIGVIGADIFLKARVGRWAVAVVLVTMLSGSLLSLIRFESVVLAADCTNAPQRAFVASLRRQQLADEWVLLDEGSVRSAERMGYLTLLELSRARVGEARLARDGVWDELEERASFLTAVDDSKAAMIFEKQGIRQLPPGPEVAARELRQGSGIGLYRVSRDGATLLYHDPSPGCGSLRLN